MRCTARIPLLFLFRKRKSKQKEKSSGSVSENFHYSARSIFGKARQQIHGRGVRADKFSAKQAFIVAKHAV